MADKVRPFLLTSLAVFILSTASFYWRMDLVLSNLEKRYNCKTQTIAQEKSDGDRLLSLDNTGKLRMTPSPVLVSDEKGDSESDGGPISEELVLESLKQFWKDQMMNREMLKDSKTWLSQSWKSRGGKYISGLDNSSKDILRDVLLELRQLQEACKTDSEHLPSLADDREGAWRGTSTDMGTVDQDSAEVGEFKFQPYGRLNLRRLVLYSSYRSSLREFTVVTLSPTVLEFVGGPFYNCCVWLSDGSTKAHFSSLEGMNSAGRLVDPSGRIRFRYVKDTHGRNYDTLVVRCSFPQAVGLDRTGGFLYLNISHSSESSELIPVFRERPGELNASIYDLTTFQYEYAYCSAPVWTNLSSSHVKQWFKYHHTLTKGNIHYFIYDNIGIDDETMAVLKPFMDKGILTVINQQRERNYDAWYHTQAPAINDCLNRARFLAKWVLFWDFDEYLHLPPPLTLPALLEQVEQQEAPWISFGNMLYSRTYCAPQSEPDEWAVQRMLLRLEKPVCGEDEIAHVCEGAMGHRKWIGNPRLVTIGSIHRALEPLLGGITLDTDVARINHYRGLAGPDSDDTNCKIIRHPLEVNDTKVDGWWIQDRELSTIVTGSRKLSSQAFDVLQ